MTARLLDYAAPVLRAARIEAKLSQAEIAEARRGQPLDDLAHGNGEGVAKRHECRIRDRRLRDRLPASASSSSWSASSDVWRGDERGGANGRA